MKRIMGRFLLLCLVGNLLVACSSMPLTSMWKLRQFDPLHIDPQGLQLVLILSDKIRVQQSKVKMSLGFTAADKSESWQQDFDLKVVRNALVPNTILREKSAEQQHYAVSLQPGDLTRFRHTQQRLLQIEQQDIDGKGMFGLGVSDFCIEGELLHTQATTDIYVRLRTDEDYIVLFKGFNLMANQDELQNLVCP